MLIAHNKAAMVVRASRHGGWALADLLADLVLEGLDGAVAGRLLAGGLCEGLRGLLMGLRGPPLPLLDLMTAPPPRTQQRLSLTAVDRAQKLSLSGAGSPMGPIQSERWESGEISCYAAS
eukprot:scaffold364746_cov15-Prasinocladus_malaysianus.AAC.1